LTLTFDPAIRHTVVHHSSTSTYIPTVIQIEETFCGRTDGRTDGRTGRHFFPLILLGRLFEVDLKIAKFSLLGQSSQILVIHPLSFSQRWVSHHYYAMLAAVVHNILLPHLWMQLNLIYRRCWPASFFQSLKMLNTEVWNTNWPAQAQMKQWQTTTD